MPLMLQPRFKYYGWVLKRLLAIALVSTALSFAGVKRSFAAAIDNFPPRAVVILPGYDENGDRLDLDHLSDRIQSGASIPDLEATKYPVQVLSSHTDSAGNRWYYVRFIPSDAEGWVEAEYVLFEAN
jgi:hypothetical protein